MKIARRKVVALAISGIAALRTATAHVACRTPDCSVEYAGKGRRQYGSDSFDLYKIGSGGPALVLLHELPGLSNCDLDLACRLSKAGYTVYAPLFFGSKGDNHLGRFLVSQCLSPFSRFYPSVWFPGHTPRVHKWLTSLIPDVHRECGGKGVGVLGMCLTGGLPVALLNLPEMKAAVLCQPTNPFFAQSSIDVTQGDMNRVRARLAEDPVDVLALRFETDSKCHESRFGRFGRELEGRFFGIVLRSAGDKNSHHSTLAMDYDGPLQSATHDAFAKVVRYLDHRLKDAPAGSDFPGSQPDCDPKFFTSCKYYPK